MQASDGNFYGATSPGSGENCVDNAMFSCGAIYRVTPAGVVTLLHTLAPGGSEGYDPNPLVIGPDGDMYGTTQEEA